MTNNGSAMQLPDAHTACMLGGTTALGRQSYVALAPQCPAAKLASRDLADGCARLPGQIPAESPDPLGTVSGGTKAINPFAGANHRGNAV